MSITTRETFASTAARDGTVLADVASCGARDIDRAVAVSRRSFEKGAWRNTAPRQRKQVLLRLVSLMGEHQEELGLLDTLNMGKPIRDSVPGEVVSAMTCIEYFAESVDKWYGAVAPSPAGTLATITHEPIGVVGAVVPWNYPLLMAAWKLGPALSVGNSVVLKPAEQSPLSALRLAELAAEAGLPDGVLNVVPGFGETAGQALGRHMDVDKLAFTGSTEVGKLFLRYAGESNMKRLSLECGGKSPQIVLSDKQDLETVAREVANGIFVNAGQVCNAGSLLIADRRIKDGLVELIAKHAEALNVGDPLDPCTEMGPVVNQQQLQNIVGHVDRATAEGASARTGGRKILEETGGAYLEPTVLDDVSPDWDVARQEIFGPVLTVLPFGELEQAVSMANSSTYGLAAAVWTDNVDRAHAVAGALRAGTVWVNCFDTSDITVPFGGVKQSGFGRDKSMYALSEYTDVKTTWLAFNTSAS